jgi:hypothetical protein
MKQKPLVTLSALVVLTVGYAAWDYFSERRDEKTKEIQTQLLQIKDINEVAIERFGPGGISSKIRLKKDEDQWKLVEPLSEVAEQSAANDLVDAAALEKYVDLVKSGDAIDWKIFGLDQAKGQVSFMNGAGQSETFEVSTKKNYLGDVFLRKTGVAKVFTAHNNWDNWINKQVLDFRDKRMMKIDQAEIESIQIRGKDTFTLVKKDKMWSTPQRPDWKLDQTKTSEIISLLTTTQAQEFIKEGPGARPEKSNLEIEVRFQNKKTWKAKFVTDNKKGHLVYTSEPPSVIKIGPQDAEKFSAKTLVSLRDRRQPFDFAKENVKKVELNIAGVKPQFILKDDHWQLVSEVKDHEVDAEKVRSLLSGLRNLEVKDFETKGGGFTEIVKLEGEDGEPVLQVAKGPEFKKKIDGQESTLVALKTNLFKTPVAIEESAFKNLGFDEILKQKVKK